MQPVRTDVGAAVAEDAAIAVDEDVELALQAALGFFEADRLGVADFDFERRVARADAAGGERQRLGIIWRPTPA